jgi:hypothetical protein
MAATAVITFLLTVAGIAKLADYDRNRFVPPPQIPAVKSATVRLHPVSKLFLDEVPPSVEFTGEDVDPIVKLVTPVKHHNHTITDWHSPIIADVTLKHDGPDDTHMLVRWMGKGPAAVTLDGRTYFTGQWNPDRPDGGTDLIQTVLKAAEKKAKSKP